jgi:hypothetical protein
MFFELLNIKTPNWTKTFIDGRRLTCALSSFLKHFVGFIDLELYSVSKIAT